MTIEDSSVSEVMARALAEEGRRVRSFIASNRSDTLLRLFDFLLQQSIGGRRPREAEIAEEVFQEGSSEPGHQGSRVRVGVYRLRKKLDLFYVDKPGARLTIRQGEYGLVLETPSIGGEEATPVAESSGAPRQGFGLIAAALSLLLLINALLALLYFSHVLGSGDSLGRSELWRSFSGEKNPPLIVMGDYFMFVRKQKSDNSDEVVQDLSIGSSDTFYAYIAKNVEMRNIFNNEDLYSVSSDVLTPVSHISSFLANVSSRPVTTSELNPDMLSSSGIIYLGALDAISPLLSNPLFQASKFRCGTTCYELIDTLSGRRFLSDSPYLLDDRIVPRRDYGYVASYPGPSGNQILILSGTGDAGAAQMANVVMDAKMVEELRQRLGGNLRSFEALYQVRTMFNRSYGSRLLIARPIDSQRMWDKTKRDE